MNYDRDELRDRLASEYVLGTLHGRARQRFQRLMRADLKTRVAVERWEQRLMPMGAALSVPAPSASVWRAIEQRVAPAPRSPASMPGFFERWFGWRTLSALAAGLVLGIAVTLSVGTLRDGTPATTTAKLQLPESYAGFLQDDRGTTRVLVSSLRHGKVVDIKWLVPPALAADQVMQLWALAKDAPPLLIGIIPVQGKGSITMSGTSEQLLSKASELAVSIEPKSNAPVATPSGAYLFRGPCAKFW